jgi:hypothetical protein
VFSISTICVRVHGYRGRSEYMKLAMIVSAIAISAIGNAMAAEPHDEKKNEKRTIGLPDIVTTSPQKGLQHVRDAWAKTNNKQSADAFLQQMQKVSIGGSNVYLVDATNLQDALSASLSTLIAPRSADTPAPVNTTNPNRGSLWLFAYLGSGPSNPTWWIIEKVELEKGKVILRYRPSKPSPATADVHPYYYWIPIGRLEPGSYELQLVNQDENSIRLMRRVDVTGTE